ncbi:MULTISPECIES: N-succinylarginine dihydrolase [unclassified Hahella]|uniref:N-succinylarginine dihydrolase n=1 Tax=unclassified Hahella TaxID=2624107 RepID=UPI001C1EBEA4|nr:MULTISPECIES: N-succinylarginine dihydrolase [unclassified Hahella]MBU6953499.1 N-succinylarginine dihydrolase [Hahella sp. HN01]MDG9671709.1 N-succinylarginine dihydrolase [Hahella sp. CR1]
MKAFEVNFDGLVGPTHNYSGLSYGNVASETNIRDVSNPKEAAKQGLRKMKALHDMGFKQGVLLPQERPDIATLRRLGFTGSDREVLLQAAHQAPVFLGAVASASCMWTANAATVSPSADTTDGRVHFTAANLNAKFHRSIEHPTTTRILQGIFNNEQHFAHHKALPPTSQFGDEGAANHTRFCKNYEDKGVELFVYGRVAFDENAPRPMKYPARQTLEACQAVARLHGLADSSVVYAQQNPAVIDQGVFHNDVIAVGNRNVLFYHEQAFLNTSQMLTELEAKLQGCLLKAVKVSDSEVSVADAVSSYLFNSQLLSLNDDDMMLVVPHECRDNPNVKAYLDDLVTRGGPIKRVEVFDLKQSMKNGGGPACLRLRVALNEAELAAVHPQVMMSEELFDTLNAWVDKHYRDRISQQDLADPQLLTECRTALDELTQLLQLGSLYPFQLA